MVDAVHLLTLYLLGVTVSFSACYFPVIPILVAIASKYSTGRGIFAVILFSLGATLSIIFYGYAIMVSMSIFSAIAETTLIQLPTLAGYLLMGLGITEFTPVREVFAALPTFSARFRKVGLVHSFIAGLLFSLAAAPCSFTPLLAFLMAVSVEGIRGGSAYPLVFSFSAGIGMTLLSVGIVSVKAGKKVVEKLGKRGLVKYQAKLSGILLIALGVLTIITGENFEAAAISGAEAFITIAEMAAIVAGFLAALSLIRVGVYLDSSAPILLGAGLLLMSAYYTSQLLLLAGVLQLSTLTSALFMASRLVLFLSLVSFLTLGRSYTEILPTQLIIGLAGILPFIDLLIAALWFAEWVRKDRLLAFSALFFIASAVTNLFHIIPDPVKPVVAALILPMHLSILPIWRKNSTILAVLSLLNKP